MPSGNSTSLLAADPVDRRVGHLPTENTPAMAMTEGGRCTHAWWRPYSGEPFDDVIVERIFKVMVSVGDGTVALDQVKAQLGPSTGDEFSRTVLLDGSA